MKKNRIYLSNDERELIIHSLNTFKAQMLSEGQFTDVVDDALFNV